MKKILTLLLLLATCLSSYSQITNAAGVGLNFTNSSLPGWTLSPGGSQSPTGYSSNGVGASIVTGISNFYDGNYTWNISPYTGQYMVSLQPGYSSPSYSAMTSALDLNSTSVTSIQNFLNAHSGGGATNPTNAAWMYYSGLNLTAGTTFTLAWNFVATDYTPWNDTSITTLVPTSGGGLATINNVLGQYSILGAINPGSGNYSTNSYGSTGWELATYQVNTTGTYELGFGSFNLGDTVNSPILLVSGSQGTTLNGTTPVAPIAPNPGSSAPSTPPPKTVVSTSTTNSTSTIIIGNQQQTITTPTTVTTYSDGTTSTSVGTATTTTISSSAFTGVHFGAAQVADTQWNVYACTQTSSCQVYSTNPGGTYNTGSWTPISSTQYITFIPNTGSDSSTNPWKMILVNQDGTFSSLGTGHILVEGTDSNGNIYMFFSNSNFNGTLLSGNLGLTGQGVTFSGTANPPMAQTNSDAGNMSSSPLSSGQTGGTPINVAPTIVSTSTADSVSSSSSIGSATTTVNQYNWNNQTFTVTGTGIPTTVTTITTPVTTNTWSDGTTTTSNGTSTTTTSTTWSYTVTGPTTPPINPNAGTNTNSVYITQVSAGSNDNLKVDQSGHGNYTSISLNGSNNTINAGQGYTYNSIGIASESLTTSNYNLLGLSVAGNTNTTTTSQIGISNSAIVGVSGNTNTVTVNQNGNNNQTYNLLNGNGNTSTIIQTGNLNLAAVNLYGDGNNASVSQTGNNHAVVVSLTNAGGPNTATVVQTGNGDAYSLQQTCTTPSGCSVTVIRNK